MLINTIVCDLENQKQQLWKCTNNYHNNINIKVIDKSDIIDYKFYYEDDLMKNVTPQYQD